MLAAILALLALAQHSDHQLGAQGVQAVLPDDPDTAVKETHWVLHLRGGVLQLAGIHLPLRCVWVQGAKLFGINTRF